ncbi:MAG: ABC transporter ATP-binding protein [Pseudomonadota bacterium]
MYFNFKLWALTEGIRDRIVWAIAMGLGSSALGIARLLALAWLLAQLFNETSLSDLLLPALGVALLIAARGYWDCLRADHAHNTAAIMQSRLRERVFNKVLELGPARLLYSRSGEVRAALVEGVERLEVYFGKYLPQFFVALLTPVVIFIVVIWVDWVVAWVFLAAALFTLFAPALFHQMDAQNSMRRAQAYSKFAAEYLDSLQGLATLKAYGQTRDRSDLLRTQADELAESTKWVLATNSMSRGITDTGIAVGAALALGVAAYRLDAGFLSFEGLLIVLMLGVEVFRPLRDLRALLHDGMLAQSAASQVFSVLEDRPLVEENATAQIATLTPSVAFSDVSFTYPGSRGQVHESLSFNINVGERIGVVGASGVGKSSIVRLLQRFYEPQQGEIRIGGVDIKTLGFEQLRQQMAVVSQDTYLFFGTVEDNLRLGKPDASNEEIHAACEAANAHEFIAALPQGYQTVIGERGLRLSGGQRQRIAIARALLRDAPILILDEALSSVDAENESIIQQALDRLMHGRTTLILAHRLSSIIGADKILVLDSGRVVEQGSHSQLIEKGGIYATLMREQTQERSQPNEVVTDRRSTPTQHAKRTGLNGAEPDASDQTVLESATLGWVGTVRKLMSYTSEYKTQLVLTFGLGVGRVVAFIGISLLSALAVAAVKNGEPYAGWLIVLAVLAASAGILHWLESWVAHDMAFRMLATMRVNLFKKLDELAPAFLLRRRSGDLVHLATEDIELIEYFYAHTIAPAFVAVLVPSAVLALLFSFHWSMAVALLPFLLIVALSPIVFRRRIDELGSRSRDVLAGLSAQTVELLQGLSEILSFQAGDTRRTQFMQACESHHVVRLDFFRHMSRHTMTTEICMSLGVLVVIMCAVPLVKDGGVDPAFVPLMALAAMSAFLPISEVADVGHQLAHTFSSTQRLATVEAEVAPVTDGTKQWRHRGSPISLGFDNVSFTYPGVAQTALDNIDVELEAGKTTALVGPSGAGKSTLAQLVMRFWDPQSGRIFLDGHDIREFELDQLRGAIGIVSQETYLFNDSLAGNLRIAKADASDAELQRAVELAELDGMVARLPDGLSTEIGEGGYALSGGQRQRLSIARAFLKDAPVLVLDEATSHLDSISERAVHKALRSLMRDRTTLIIAHRLSTIRDADSILVIDNGQLVEAGKHDELLEHSGLYAHLVAQQMQAGN